MTTGTKGRVCATKGRACGTKKRHATADGAHAHRERLISRGACPARLRVYACRHGKPAHWHVGHVGKRAA